MEGQGPGSNRFSPDRPGPNTGKKRPKITENGGPVHGRDPLRQSVGCPFAVNCPVFTRNWCRLVSVGPVGPRLCHTVRNQKTAVSWARRSETRFRRPLFPVQRPTFRGFRPPERPKHHATPGFCPPGARFVTFQVILACACPPRAKTGPGSVKTELSKGPCTTRGAQTCVLGPF